MKIRSIALRLLLLLALVALLAGCPRSRGTQDAVDVSNQALLAQFEGDRILGETSVPGLTPPGGGADPVRGLTPEQWSQRVKEQRDQAIARIDGFIEKYGASEGLQKTVHALRLRKAVLLMVSGERNLALATFADVDRSQAGNARDLALIDSAEALTWWWGVAGKTVEPTQFKTDAAKHVDTLDEVIEAAPEGSGIAYYLATLRAHVHLKWASTESDRRIMLKKGLETYCNVFDDEARQNVARWVSEDPTESKAIPTENLRWYGHVPITFGAYDATYRAFLNEIKDTVNAPDFEPGDVDPALVEAARETDPVWPAACRWMVDLPRKAS